MVHPLQTEVCFKELSENPFENIVRKENLCYIFFFSQKCFFVLFETEISQCVWWVEYYSKCLYNVCRIVLHSPIKNLSSASASNLDQHKILSFGKE